MKQMKSIFMMGMVVAVGCCFPKASMAQDPVKPQVKEDPQTESKTEEIQTDRKAAETKVLQENYVGFPLLRHNKKLYVEVSLNGKDCYFMLDSGATGIYVATELCSYFECELKEAEQKAVTLAGARKTHYAYISSFVVGDYFTLSTPFIAAISMPDYAKPYTNKEGEECILAGLIGNDVLQKMEAAIDYENQMLLLPRPSQTKTLSDIFPAKTAIRQELTYDGTHHYMDATFGTAGVKGRLMIDSGCYYAVIDQTFCKKNNIALTKGEESEIAYGVDGERVQLYYGNVGVIKITGKELSAKSWPAIDLTEVGGGKYSGLFGAVLLEGLNVVYDFGNNCLYFRKK